MWLLFGVIAVLATFINLYLYKTSRTYYFAMAIGLSFTILTLTASYSMVSNWVNVENWTALSDVVPTMSIAFWILASLSILLNILPIILELKHKKQTDYQNNKGSIWKH